MLLTLLSLHRCPTPLWPGSPRCSFLFWLLFHDAYPTFLPPVPRWLPFHGIHMRLLKTRHLLDRWSFDARLITVDFNTREDARVKPQNFRALLAGRSTLERRFESRASPTFATAMIIPVAPTSARFRKDEGYRPVSLGLLASCVTARTSERAKARKARWSPGSRSRGGSNGHREIARSEKTARVRAMNSNVRRLPGAKVGLAEPSRSYSPIKRGVATPYVVGARVRPARRLGATAATSYRARCRAIFRRELAPFQKPDLRSCFKTMPARPCDRLTINPWFINKSFMILGP